MRLRLALAVVVLQVVALAFMAWERETVILHGRSVLLRTAPIDPNDPMRGDYVRLTYDISTVPKELCRDGTAKMVAPNGYVYSRQWRANRVYAVLKQDAAGLPSLDYLTDRKPDNGLFIRGRIESVSDRQLTVRYGIEAYFMQQGLAKKLEDQMRGERAGCPLDMSVAVGGNGIAVLQDHHWGPLGLTVDFTREPVSRSSDQAANQRAGQPNTRLIGLTLTLKNHGAEEIAVVDLPKGGSFRLVPDTRWNEAHYRSAEPDFAPDTPKANQVVVLKPGQTHVVKVDLRASRWFAVDTRLPAAQQKPVPLSEIMDDWSARFRIEYSPPPPDKLSQLPNASLIRQGNLRTRAFNAQQGLD